MRHLLLVMLVAAAGATTWHDPALAQSAGRAGQPAPAPRPAQPSAARRAQPAARAGMAITVTDPRGATLQGIHVQMLGATDRSAETNASGQINFPGLQPGTYRLRFSGDGVITFEREVTLRAGQIADIDITLNADDAPSPTPTPTPDAKASPSPTVAPAPQAGPPGQPLTLSILEVLEKNYVGTQPRRETLVSCSGSTRTMMIQLNMPMPDRLYETADAVYYVVGGEGVVRIQGRETKLGTNGFVSVPRNTAHSFVRGGRRPLILLAVLSGEPCEEPR